METRDRTVYEAKKQRSKERLTAEIAEGAEFAKKRGRKRDPSLRGLRSE